MKILGANADERVTEIITVKPEEATGYLYSFPSLIRATEETSQVSVAVFGQTFVRQDICPQR